MTNLCHFLVNFDEQGDDNAEERVVPIENPIIPQDEEPEVPTTDEVKAAVNIKKENAENKSLNEESEVADNDKEKTMSDNEHEDGLVPAMKVEAVLEKDDDEKG